jgi:hypothetical protein
MKRNSMIVVVFLISSPCFAQSILGGSNDNSLHNPSSKSLGEQSMSAGINTILTKQPSQYGTTTIVNQGGSGFTMMTGDGRFYTGVTNGNGTQIVGPGGKTITCVSNSAGTNCQ